GFTRAAVMDGKTLVHRICRVDDCHEPLANYRDGIYCTVHLRLAHQCDDHRSEVPMHPQLPQGPNGEEGEAVIHHFRAGTIYCVQTVQWACGVPIGWGKCYKSESPSQVLRILNQIFSPNHSIIRPSFIFYDNACKLLAHIVTQDPNSPWLDTTRFLVDSWHYVNHRATDQLCREWCNPAPADGSQPDLVIKQTDSEGNIHTVRAYNTETAEQLNSWLTSFEAPLRQMTDWNFDFFMHVLMYLYLKSMVARLEEEYGSDDDNEDD
ncbi:hypothetical protein M407DRAFT_82978, partial [Tulasnella calospora MUT 4182]